MALDTTAILQEIETTQQEVYTRSQGIANLSTFTDFSPTEKESIAKLAAVYRQENEALQLGHAFFEQLPQAIHVEDWERMRDVSIEFLDKLSAASTYEEWRVVMVLAEEWFRLIREIARDDVWTTLLGNGVRFFQIMTENGHPHLPTLPVPASMVATLNREIEEARAAQSLFVTEEPIARKIILDVSEEESI